MKKWTFWCVVLGLPLCSHATTHYVDINSTNPIPPYTSWATAATNIQDAVDVAGRGHLETVLVTNGVYFLEQLHIADVITITSVNGAANTYIIGSVDMVLDHGSTINGFTFVDAEYLRIDLYDRGSLENCRFEFCDYISLYANHDCVLKDCFIRSDGFLEMALISVGIERCVFEGGYGNIQVDGHSTAVNSIFALHEVDMDVLGLTCSNCTLSIWDSFGRISASEFENCIVDADGYVDAQKSYYHNSCTPYAEHGVGGNINVDPQLINLGSGVLAPLPSSPCIDAGLAPNVPGAKDVIGNSRFIGSEVDMGAVEYCPGLEVLDERIFPNKEMWELAMLVTNSPDMVSADWQNLLIPDFPNSFTPTGEQTVSVYIWPDEEQTVLFKGTNSAGETCYDAVVVVPELHYVDGATPVHYVSPVGGNIAPYTSWETAAHVIQDAVTVASEGDTILVTNGAYAAGVAIDEETGRSRVALWKDVVLRSVNGPEFTQIVGEPSLTAPGDLSWDTRAVYIGTTGGTARVEGVSLTNGYARAQTGMFSESGGGVLVYQGGVVSNCHLTGNTADAGGGAAIINDGMLADSLIAENTAIVGGGGGIHGSEATVTRCTITHNQSETLAGGVRVDFSELENCLISGNEADQHGAGFLDSCTLYNCTIASNMDAGAENLFLSTCTINNSIIATHPSQYPGVADYGSVFNYSCIPPTISSSVAGVGNLDVDPMLVDAGLGSFRLPPFSPCVNAGSNSLAISSTELDGKVRIFDFYVDMGAYECHNLGDMDGDGMSDGYEVFYFGGKTNAVESNDTDHDGQTDGEEFITGMSPLDSNSLFVASIAYSSTNGFATVGWEARIGRQYSVWWWAPGLTSDFEIIAQGIEYPAISYTDTVFSAFPAGLYRVEVQYIHN